MDCIISFALHPACLIAILSAGRWDYPRGGSKHRVSDLTDLPLLWDLFFSSTSAYTPEVPAPFYVFQAGPGQAPAGMALMTSSLLPLFEHLGVAAI